MNAGIEKLRIFLDKVPARLKEIAEPQSKPASDKWSAKEELGHLIDSAANNHQRIVRVQSEDKLSLPGYQQDQWVKVHGYQRRDWQELIELWSSFNQQLLIAATSVPDAAWANTCRISDLGPLTLKVVFEDYLDHMLHHLEHIGLRADDLK